MSMTRVPEWLEKSCGNLRTFMQQLAQLRHLNQIWPTLISDELVNNSRVANLRDQILVVELDNATWVTALRFRMPNILEALKKHPEYRQIQKIEWYVLPTTKAAEKQPELTLSAASANLIIETAEQTPHEKLREALMHLASHSHSKDK